MALNFNEIFDAWSNTYDQTVTGHDPEYIEVFKDYELILEEVASKSTGNIIEFGVGTGNLTEKLLSKGKNVYGYEPSDGMRKVAKKKLPKLTLEKGDFLEFNSPSTTIESIVSTYAFHHLTDQEKAEAIKKYNNILGMSGKIIFADTVFITEDVKRMKIKEAENSGFFRLANDLKTEYYTTIPVLQEIFHSYGFSSSFTQKNNFVWLIEAIKLGGYEDD